MVAGALRVATAFIPYDPESALLEGLFAFIDCGLLFGLIAVYLMAGERLGWSGLACFSISLAALASIVGPDSTKFGVDWYKVGAATFLIALSGLAACLIRERTLVAASACWILALMIGLLATWLPPAFAASGALLGVGYLLAGRSLLRTPPALQSA